jgi:hypothetical protein
MPTFLGRRYARPLAAVSATEKAVGACVLLLVVGILGAFAITVATNRDYLFTGDERMEARAVPDGAAFPAAGLAGWRAPDKVEHFSPDDLYIKIDGQADVLLRFHVAGLTFGTYTGTGDPAPSVDVYWYNMGTPADAEEMYRSELPPGTTPLAIGAAGYQVGGAVFFWKNASYVQVLPSQPDEAGGQAARQIAERIAERIP